MTKDCALLIWLTKSAQETSFWITRRALSRERLSKKSLCDGLTLIVKPPVAPLTDLRNLLGVSFGTPPTMDLPLTPPTAPCETA
jgi:hypothetical protein